MSEQVLHDLLKTWIREHYVPSVDWGDFEVVKAVRYVAVDGSVGCYSLELKEKST